ncbi:2-C-methyl-D-erythritol 4-phosphate cytidylyltransferase [Paenibacillus hunanensis]|uniref:2-C-methyl-D-erythritol 4-phosphate cytidylyltransferase n=1 Tax=Paenibacillus hunanensis TaxID=539262 RepID=A0ABU1J3P6_9BACL|nr:2-C-methyl-D-erythritol 4-phosphate cytidylyltransferase [Paenibacillus hunanensis]MCL9663279.1 2-C-methyl-D-erythritol 4-phosphate cytidylyltransferase [Paenibacillus hunanensis]MDR6246131.1 2-C-methyl-D-erythritol 4-phosphate cytidylyltransferase [Paenibacillus hunanensis]GGJ29327.1 2-C-methyl-D-erythritol 4-phosphate cytidylyltransferase [Paenibacillus hunanensis]
MAQKAGIIVVAAGKGSRMGTVESKQYLRLQNKPIIIHTLEVFERSELVDEIVVVTGADDLERCKDWIKEYGLLKVTEVVAGGYDRQESVYLGLQQLQSDWVMVHDGVRPFVTEQQLHHCLEAAQQVGASVLAVPVKDTIKQVDRNLHIADTPDRSTLWAIQTPQTFRYTDLLAAHQQAEATGFRGTDDAMLVERLGTPITVVEGSYTNIKLTTPDDLDYAAYLLARKGENRS